jgi:hypothetical protein
MITAEESRSSLQGIFLASGTYHAEDIVAHSFVISSMTFDFVIRYYCEKNVFILFTTIPPHRINLHLAFHRSNSVTG